MSTQVNISVSGMSCASCVARVEKVLNGLEGVNDASVNLTNESATVVVDNPKQTAGIVEALEKSGYPPVKEDITLSIEGMTCASCVARVERALSAVPGVVEVNVNLASETAQITVLEGSISFDAVSAAVAEAGYAAKIADSGIRNESVDRRSAEIEELRRLALISGLLTLPVFVLEMGSHFIPGVHQLIGQTIGHQTSWMMQFILTSIVLVGPGRRFFVKGIPALFRGTPDMNSLVAIGTIAAWGYSTVALFAPGLLPEGTRAVYFEAAAVIATLILLGRFLEARAKGRTGAAIQRLIGLRPKTARIERNDDVVEVPISEIARGDTLHARPGERLAVDGVVLTGSSYVDESMITGEPVPVEKAKGAAIVGGTINGTGALTYEATAVGEATLLAQIIRMVEVAQGSKLPIQGLVDRITAVFVPVVMALAVLTVFIWLIFGPDPALSLALVAGVSVLIIACPCAMGLATPTSIMVGTGRAAELGVLFRKGDALQGLQNAKVIAVDKTGTLTLGQPELTSLKVASGWSEEEGLRLIASVEKLSEHPIAQALVRAAEGRGLDIETPKNFQAVIGMGAVAEVDGHQVIVGADRFMQSEGIDYTNLKPESDEIAVRGETPLFAAVDGATVAAIGVSDPIKPGTPAAIAAIHDLGLKIAMITGDNSATAKVIAGRLNIDHVVAEVMPDGKVVALKELREAHGSIAFVGDGINDAPALAEADTGIAIGTGTDVAIEAADVVLMSGDLAGVVNALSISRATMRNIRQNLFWAFGYNVALIPVAAGLFYPFWGTLLSPMLAAGAMALSSVFVLSNALRLRRIAPVLVEVAGETETALKLKPLPAE